MVRTRRKEYSAAANNDDDGLTSKKRKMKYKTYDETDEEDDFFADDYRPEEDDMIDSEMEELSEEEVKKLKQAKVRVPKKKVKKTTEERLKQVVGEDNSQIMEEEAADQEDDDGSGGLNTKRLLDARSKKAKRMDWEQGEYYDLIYHVFFLMTIVELLIANVLFRILIVLLLFRNNNDTILFHEKSCAGFFYLPKFDCYLPRHILHSILGYLPAFPYYLTIRLTSQQWLDDFDNVICQEVKELDLIQRNENPDATIKYRYPWYNSQVSTRMNNDCIRFLGVLFPNIEKLILPCVNDRLRVPQRLLSSFPKLSHVQIFFLPPFNSWRSCYRQDVIDCQNLDYTFVQNFAKILRFKSDQSNLVSIPNNAKSEDVINTLKYFVETERFSLDKTDIITSLHPTSFTPSLIDYILQVHEKQQKAGYERITFTQERIMNSSLFFGLPDAIMDYMLETQFFKKLTSTESIISSSFVNSLLTSITSLKMAKLLFEQAEWPFVFDEVKNPLLILIANSRNTSVTSELISFFCNLKPGLISLGDENGIISNEVASLNILNLYLNMQKGLNADDSIIEALHRNGADITFVCPNTGNNFLHICPYSECKWNFLQKVLNNSHKI